MLGCGSVGRCTLPLVLRHVDMPADRITVMDFEDVRPKIEDSLQAGVVFKQARLTQDNYASMLAELVGPGDIIVDLSWNVETFDMLEWCGEHDVRYLNTSLEEWDPYGDIENKSPYERSLYSRQMRIRQLKDRLNSRGQPSPTAIIDHGANPGLVSHFTKRALLEIATSDDREGTAGGHRRQPGRRSRSSIAEAESRGRGIVCPAEPGDRHQGDPHLGARHAGVVATEGRSTNSSTPGRSKASTRKAPRRPSSDGARTSAGFRSTPTRRSAGPATRSSSRSRAFARSCTPGSLPAGRSSGWSSAMPSPSPSATT